MGELLMRRRGMVPGGEKEDTSIVYSLPAPMSFSNGQYYTTEETFAFTAGKSSLCCSFIAPQSSYTGIIAMICSEGKDVNYPAFCFGPYLYNNNPGVRFYIYSDTKLYLFKNNGAGDITIDYSKPVLFVINKTSSTSDYYVKWTGADGTPCSRTGNSGGTPTNPQSKRIMFGSATGVAPFTGTILSAIFRNRILTNAEITKYLNS